MSAAAGPIQAPGAVGRGASLLGVEEAGGVAGRQGDSQVPDGGWIQYLPHAGAIEVRDIGWAV